MTGDPFEETRLLLAELAAAENVVSESHLAVWNGTLGHCQDGVPRDAITRRCLEILGYPPTETGLLQSIREGRCRVGLTRGGENVLVEGEAAEAAWRAGEGHVTIGFPVNPPLCIFAAATERRPDGRFVVDAMASDGGGIPRNLLVTSGLAMVRMGAISLRDLATKLAWAPSLMLGLPDKGHLGPGADADVTVVNETLGRATLSIAGGPHHHGRRRASRQRCDGHHDPGRPGGRGGAGSAHAGRGRWSVGAVWASTAYVLPWIAFLAFERASAESSRFRRRYAFGVTSSSSSEPR